MADLEIVERAARELVADLDRASARIAVGAGDDEVYPAVAQALDRCLANVSRLGLWGPANRLPSSVLWNIAGHYLARGWMQNQARTKPRGYAGDYELLSRMYENRRCDDPLGRLFDRYFQEEAAPRAVRNRMRMMAEWIVAAAAVDRPLKVAVVGSAFGLDMREALLKLDPDRRRRIHVVLLDLDPAAIESARGQLAPLLAPEQLTAAALNLFRLPQRPQGAALLDNSELIFCPGLLDYMDDAAAGVFLRCLHGRLAPGGQLTAFQFAPHSSTRAYMEWLGNWYLLYRDETQFREVIDAAFPGQAAEFGAEPVGVDLYVTLRRTGFPARSPATD
jgi:extracellular factor (EF) 3-hydroxypalmitic acid methyl ester biosynthesis protein